MKFNQNTKVFIHETESENIVGEMAAILSRGDELSKYLRYKTAATARWRKQGHERRKFDGQSCKGA